MYIYIYADLRYMQPFWIELHCLFFAVVLIVRLRCTASHAGLHGECRLCVCWWSGKGEENSEEDHLGFSRPRCCCHGSRLPEQCLDPARVESWEEATSGSTRSSEREVDRSSKARDGEEEAEAAATGLQCRGAAFAGNQGEGRDDRSFAPGAREGFRRAGCRCCCYCFNGSRQLEGRRRLWPERLGDSTDPENSCTSGPSCSCLGPLHKGLPNVRAKVVQLCCTCLPAVLQCLPTKKKRPAVLCSLFPGNA